MAAVAAVLGMAACGGGAGPSSLSGASAVVVLTSASFQQMVLDSSRPSLVDFQQPGCSACLAMTPTVEDLAQSFRNRALVGTVDIATERELSSEYRIWATPTFVVIRDGREVARRVGVTSYGDLAGLLEAAIAGG
jgi:thioredoxin 1